MLISEHLHVIMPALSAAKREACLPFLQEALAEFSVDTPPRMAAFWRNRPTSRGSWFSWRRSGDPRRRNAATNA
jgi:hypothetical protein